MTTPVQIFAQVFVVGPAVALSILVTALIARSAGAIGRDQNRYVIAGALVLAAWFGASTAIAAAGGFSPAVTGNAALLLLALSLALPLAVGVTVGLTSSPIRRLISQSNIQPGVIAVHALRIVPGSVFVVMAGLGVLPAIFAVPAGLGDVLAGLVALLASRWVTSGRWGSVLTWNVFGLLDFISAAVLGLATAPGPLHILETNPTSALLLTQPLVIVVTFMVPVYMLLHLVSVRYLVASRSTATFSHVSPPAARSTAATRTAPPTAARPPSRSTSTTSPAPDPGEGEPH